MCNVREILPFGCGHRTYKSLLYHYIYRKNCCNKEQSFSSFLNSFFFKPFFSDILQNVLYDVCTHNLCKTDC